MLKRTDLKIPYGVSDFKTIRNEGLYYVDKTMFLAKLEERDRFVFFVRPRRFGKSLFISMMQAYYDRREPANFRSLFHYYGILSMAERRKGMTYFKIPNACVEQQLFNYLGDSYRRVKLPDWIGWSMLASGMAYDGAWEPFLRRLAEDFANTTPIRGDISGEIRLQGYMQAEFGHIRYYLAKPEMEVSRGYCDFCLFPERVYSGDVRDSYIVELKYSKPNATDAEIAAKAEEGWNFNVQKRVKVQSKEKK